MSINNPVIVIGSGISGLNFALNVAEFRDVVILTKKEAFESSSNYAQGGIAAVISKYDSFDKHVADSMAAGSNHNNKEAVEFMVERGPKAIDRLIDFGVHFETFDGNLALTREGGHSESRIAFKGDYTGKEIEEALIERVREHEKIQIIEHAFCSDLALDSGRVVGVHFFARGEQHFIASDSVVIATGGIGQLYKYTSNPSISTGDGFAMAYLAGAQVSDMEFVQFHPTAFIPEDGDRPFLISETLRGEGAKLVNSIGERFMTGKHEMNELAPRDIVTAEINRELKHGPVYLDITHKNRREIKLRFPSIYKYLSEHGIDMASDLIPIQPAAHYMCGGVKIDFKGHTSVEGLYAFGEVAYTGVHGANRLASNSLLEALVFSSELADELKKKSPKPGFSSVKIEEPTYEFDFRVDLKAAMKDLRNLMWDKVGIVRDVSEVKLAMNELSMLAHQLDISHGSIVDSKYDLVDFVTYRNMLITAHLIAEAASKRISSLGCHIIG